MSRTAVEAPDCNWFFKQLSAAKSRVLLVDYDGTIAPFHADRNRAVPYPDVPDLLNSIMTTCNTRVVVVSGRSAYEVRRLIGTHPIPDVWGTHGIERIAGDGRRNDVQVSEDALQILAKAETQLEAAGFAEQIEVKLAGVAVHWRGLSASKARQIKRQSYGILQALVEEPGLVLSGFEEGLELRLSCANKGDAVRDLISQVEPGVPIAYLGDDSTDEDAFKALKDRGLTVLVAPKYRPTAARSWLTPPADLVQFFTRWVKSCGGAR